MTQNDSFISFVNLSFSQNFDQKRGTINQKDSWKLRNSIPNVTGNGLYGRNNNDILLLALKIFGSKR
jgi:hypothetical protein